MFIFGIAKPSLLSAPSLVITSDFVFVSRITVMLISVVFLYLVLVCPSTVLALMVDYIVSQSHASLKGYQIAIVITNMAQAIFFSMNFGLYCSISKPFRDSVSSQLLCKRSSGRMTTESKNRYKAVAFFRSWICRWTQESKFFADQEGKHSTRVPRWQAATWFGNSKVADAWSGSSLLVKSNNGQVGNSNGGANAMGHPFLGTPLCFFFLFLWMAAEELSNFWWTTVTDLFPVPSVYKHFNTAVPQHLPTFGVQFVNKFLSEL